MSLPVQWFKHIRSQDKKEEFVKTIMASNVALGRMKEIIEERMSNLDSQDLSEGQFESPAWDKKMAFNLGRRAAYKEIHDLLKMF